MLLQEGIGDTIRISLTPEPGGARTGEVIVGQEILQTMGLRTFTPMVIACPGCGRTTSTVFQELASQIQTYLRDADAGMARSVSRRREDARRGDGLHRQRSGRIEARQYRHQPAGLGRNPAAPVFVDGEKVKTLRGEHIAEEFQQIVSDYVERRYGTRRSSCN